MAGLGFVRFRYWCFTEAGVGIIFLNIGIQFIYNHWGP
jgi:hypothetical protein